MYQAHVSARSPVSSFAFLILIGFVLCIAPVERTLANEPLLNINTAGPALLAERLPGIGPAKAKAIVAYREQHGPFKTIDLLTEVKGIGPGILKKIRPLVFVDTKDLQQSSAVDTGDVGVGEQKTQRQFDRAARNAVRAAVRIAKRYEASRQ